MRAVNVSTASRSWLRLLLLVLMPLCPSGALGTPGSADLSPAGVSGPDALAGAPAAGPAQGSDLLGTALTAAWQRGDTALAARVRRTQTAAAESGLREVEGAALAALSDATLGSDLERSLAAVALAPGLPAAHFAKASAQWRAGAPIDAIDAAVAGLSRVPSHLPARLWADVALWTALVRTLLAAGLLYLAAACLLSLAPAARALPRLHDGWPMVSSLALLACLVVLPAALGEGVLGLVAGALCVSLIPGGHARRLSVLAAAAAVWLALFPALDRQGLALATWSADPVGVAGWQMGRGPLDAGARQRFAARAASDREAAHAVALQARRQGRLELAASRYEPLLQAGTPRVENDAANVLLALGRAEEAIALYEAASRSSLSPLLRVNLSQAYGTLVKLDQQDLALAEAQSIDATYAADLSGVLSGARSGTTFDFPMQAGTVIARARAESTWRDGEAIARSLRRGVAPGVLGQGGHTAAAALSLAAAAGLALAVLGRSRRPRHARRSGERLLKRLLGALRALLRVAVPGAAGLVGARPLLGLLATLLACLAGALYAVAALPVVDPLALGSGRTWLALGGASCAGLLYALVTGATLLLGDRS